MPYILKNLPARKGINDIFKNFTPSETNNFQRILSRGSFRAEKLTWDQNDVESNGTVYADRSVDSNALSKFRDSLKANNDYVDLSNNDFGKHMTMFYHIMDSFNDKFQCTTYLNLSGNKLRHLNDDAGDCENVLSQDYLAIKYLDLSDNGIGISSAANICPLINSSVTHLSLANNRLLYVKEHKLAKMFSLLPPNLVYLDLSNNYIYHDRKDSKSVYPLYNVVQAFSSLPKSVTHLNLSNNIYYYQNYEQLIPFLKMLPEHIELVTISPELTIDLAGFRTLERIIQLVENEMAGEETEYKFKFEPKELPWAKQIDEQQVLSFIKVLEQDNHPTSLLICAFLLEGRIPNTVDNDGRDIHNYMETRVHRAIDFYDRLLHPDFGIDVKLRSYIEFILWEIKTVSEVPSIQKRLSTYNVTPEDFFSKIHKPNALNIKTIAFNIMDKDRKSDSQDARFFSPKRDHISPNNEGAPQKRLKLTTQAPIEEDTQSYMEECTQGEDITRHTNTAKRPGIFSDRELPDAKCRKIDKTESAEKMQMEDYLSGDIAGHTNATKRPGIYSDRDLPDAKIRRTDKTESTEDMRIDEPTFQL